jgi:macrolide transport system ATP-binding/permease protein
VKAPSWRRSGNSDRVQRNDSVGDLLQQLDEQQRAILVVAAFCLVIAALGMLTIGLASVAEQSRELVVRRAVGATRAEIRTRTLSAAVIVGLIAAAAAIGLAQLGVEVWIPTRIATDTAIQAPNVPWSAAAWAAATSSSPR